VIGLLGYEDCADSSLAIITSNTPSAMLRSACAITGLPPLRVLRLRDVLPLIELAYGGVPA